MIAFQFFGAIAIFVLSLFSGAWSITEQEAVLIALEKNPDIRVHRINLAQDSLGLAVVRAESGLKAVVSGDKAAEVHPATRYSFDGNADTRGELNTSLGAEVSTTFPGGGGMRAGVEGRGSRNFDSSKTAFSTVTSLEATQPLLRDAWSNSPRDYALNVERRNLEISQESFRSKLVDVLTRIRGAYLDWLSAVKTLEIRQVELDYARNTLDYEKARYLLGEKAEMDTLTAALELLRAGENLLSVQYDVKMALNRFTLELGLDTNHLSDTAGARILFAPLPSAQAIMAQVKSGNADIRVLDITREILALQLAHRQNTLLPRLDVSAGTGTIQNGNHFFSSSGATALKPNTLDSWVGVSFSYDLLSRRERLMKKQAELQLKSNKVEKQNLLRQLEVSVSEFVDAWSRDSARLAIRTAEVRIAGKNHEYALQRYQLGEIDNLARLKAQNDVINARLNRLLADVSLKRLEIAVDKATTNVLNRFGVKIQ